MTKESQARLALIERAEGVNRPGVPIAVIYLVEELITQLKAAWEREGRMKEHLELALSFCPKGPVPEGLDPTFYHTLVYEDEVKLQERIDSAREALSACYPKEET